MDKSSGELVTLTPNNNNTVQPVALMRLGVFVRSLPYRQLRKRAVPDNQFCSCSLPYRQLRKNILEK